MDYGNSLNEYDYLLHRIAFRIAPTLLELKPSCLINLTSKNGSILKIWDKYKHKISFRLEVRFLEMKRSPDRILVLFYKRKILAKYLAVRENREFLNQNGYDQSFNSDQSLLLLKKRFELDCPHETGIFLGFPCKDVKAFIENKGSGGVMCRYWKVYDNPQLALKIFERYDLAKMIVMLVMIDPLYSMSIATGY